MVGCDGEMLFLLVGVSIGQGKRIHTYLLDYEKHSIHDTPSMQLQESLRMCDCIAQNPYGRT